MPDTGRLLEFRPTPMWDRTRTASGPTARSRPRRLRRVRRPGGELYNEFYEMRCDLRRVLGGSTEERPDGR